MTRKPFPAWPSSVPATLPPVELDDRPRKVKAFTIRSQTDTDRKVFAGRRVVIVRSLADCVRAGWDDSTGVYVIAKNVFSFGCTELHLRNEKL